MRITISILALFFIQTVLAQRISFDDPDLTFSIKKPKDWEIFDNGLVVKLAPSPKDSSHTYLTITYFQAPSPINLMDSDMPQLIPFESSSEIKKGEGKKAPFKIAKAEAMLFESQVKGDQALQIRNYTFKRMGQDWEVVTSAPLAQSSAIDRQFERIMKSLKVSD